MVWGLVMILQAAAAAVQKFRLAKVETPKEIGLVLVREKYRTETGKILAVEMFRLQKEVLPGNESEILLAREIVPCLCQEVGPARPPEKNLFSLLLGNLILQEIHLIFLENVQFLCPENLLASPEILLILREIRRGVLENFQSPFSENHPDGLEVHAGLPETHLVYREIVQSLYQETHPVNLEIPAVHQEIRPTGREIRRGVLENDHLVSENQKGHLVIQIFL